MLEKIDGRLPKAAKQTGVIPNKRPQTRHKIVALKFKNLI